LNIGEKKVENSQSSKAGFSTMFLNNVENYCSCAVGSEADSACAIDLYEKVLCCGFRVKPLKNSINGSYN